MTQIETAQYITDEFIDDNKTVRSVEKSEKPLTMRINFTDETHCNVIGKFAVELGC